MVYMLIEWGSVKSVLYRKTREKHCKLKIEKCKLKICNTALTRGCPVFPEGIG